MIWDPPFMDIGYSPGFACSVFSNDFFCCLHKREKDSHTHTVRTI